MKSFFKDIKEAKIFKDNQVGSLLKDTFKDVCNCFLGYPHNPFIFQVVTKDR